MTSLDQLSGGWRSQVALVTTLVVAGSGMLFAGCGSSGDSSGTVSQVTLPTVTAPKVSTAPAPVVGQDQPATEGVKKTAATPGKQATGSPVNSDQAEAQQSGSTDGSRNSDGPSDEAKAKNPGAYGGGSTQPGPTDEQRARD
jgi:hypothetical protein